jgi:hypothetical protein
VGTAEDRLFYYARLHRRATCPQLLRFGSTIIKTLMVVGLTLGALVE